MNSFEALRSTSGRYDMIRSGKKLPEMPLTRGYRNTTQQLPKRAAKYIREAIIPKPGNCLVAADYSGQEVRIMAAYSGDEKLIKAYNPCYKCQENNGGKGVMCQFGKCAKEDHSKPDSRCNIVDIHSYVTAQVYSDIVDVPIIEIKEHPVWDAYRTRCKAVTFNDRGAQQ